MYVYFVWFKVPPTCYDPAIEADYLLETEGVFVVVHISAAAYQTNRSLGDKSTKIGRLID